MIKLLITCFGPFPGVPFNPSERIARRISASRRLRARGVAAEIMRLETCWREAAALPRRLAKAKPDLIVMFGVAARRRKISIERRGLAGNDRMKLDAESRRARLPARGSPAAAKTRFRPEIFASLLRRQGYMAQVSNDAGGYLCNAAYYAALGTGIPVLFVHVPGPMPRLRPKCRTRRGRMNLAAITRACLEIVLKTASQTVPK